MILLAALLDDDDMDAAECLDTLKEYLGEADVEKELQEIEEHIDQYDFESALEVLENIAEKLHIQTRNQ